MRAIRLQEPHRLEYVEVPEPAEPKAGEVLVKSHRMGICGTDIKAFHGKQPFIEYPLIPGHELGVEVLAVGPGVDHVKVGDRCCIEPYLNCGHCFACRQGSSNCCLNNRVLGVRIDGGLCERLTICADKVHPANNLNYDQLALVETLAIGCHAAERGLSVRPTAGQHALIIGVGPIGLATLEFLRLADIQVTVMDQMDSKLDFCRARYGVNRTILAIGTAQDLETAQSLTDGDLYSVVFDATGSKASMAAAHQFVAATGTLVYVGITQQEIPFWQPPFHWKEITLRMSRNALPRDFQTVISRIEDGSIDTTPWITHRTSFDTVVADFAGLTLPETGVLKAMIDLP